MTRFELFPFQKKGVDFLLANRRCLLSDDMGLGKSVQAIEAVAQMPGDVVNVLVICPASLTIMWERIARQWFGENVCVVQLKETKKAVALTGRVRFVLCSYNYIQKPEKVARINKLKWHIVIADESHALKNWTNKTTKGFRAIVDRTTAYIWMMTGTPATRNAADYFTYLKVIESEKWGTLSAFREMFCNKVRDYWSGGYKYEGMKDGKPREILRLAFSKVMLRRLKKDVWKEMPEKLVSVLPVFVNQDRIFENLESENEVKAILKNLRDPSKPIQVLPPSIMRALMKIGEGKVDAAIEYILNCNEPIVVSCCHTEVLHRIKKGLLAAGKKSVSVTGQQSRMGKDNAVMDFQEGVVDIILVNIKAGGVGITLHRARHMLIVEQYWSPAVMEQMIDRIVRIGQQAPCVQITHLIASGTLDEDVMDALEYKARFMKKVMGDS